MGTTSRFVYCLEYLVSRGILFYNVFWQQSHNSINHLFSTKKFITPVNRFKFVPVLPMDWLTRLCDRDA